MNLRLGLYLSVAAWAASSPALAAGNVDYCSLAQARIDVSRIDGAVVHLFRQEDIGRYYPDRAERMGVSGLAILTCVWNGEGMDCVVQEAAPGDYGFDTRSVRLMRLFSHNFVGPATFRVDYTILEPGTCNEPFVRAPAPRLPLARRR